ncbi:MAG: nuclear transport factor 2 family protein [Thermoanaerobaculales bacterium]|jgi:hypothetical protein
MPTLLAAIVLVAMLQPAALPAAEPEAAVANVLEELRKGELFLDAEQLAPYVAASFTRVDKTGRISGSFAFLEPIRRQRERGTQVKELTLEQTLIQVYGGSAIATYHYRQVWVEAGARHLEQGWSSDVFEKREDGAWLLIHRHRGN